MRQGILAILAAAALGWQTPSLSAQYPYPYTPPQPYPPVPYGYQAPMMRPPAYLPNPMMARPMYYNPSPMPTSPVYPVQAIGAPRVYNFSPASDDSAAAAPGVAPPPAIAPPPAKVQKAQGAVIPPNAPNGA